MDMTLRNLILKVEGQGSVEGRFREFVKDMPEAQKLETAMEFCGKALDMNERAQDVAMELWELILKEGWWRVRFQRVEDFTAESGMKESVATVAKEREVTRGAKRRYAALAARRLGCANLDKLLGDLMPSPASKSFLETMKTLALKVSEEEKEDVVELLRAARDARVNTVGAIKDATLQRRDVIAVLERLRGGKRVRAIMESRLESTGEGTEERIAESVESTGTEERMAESVGEPAVESMVESIVESTAQSTVESTVESTATDEMDSSTEEGEGRVCGCNNVEIAQRILEAMRAPSKTDLKGKVEVVGSMRLEEWRRICHRHVRAIASCWELQTTRLKREELIERVMDVQRDIERLDELRTDEETYLWFRKEGRPGREEDSLGPFKFAGRRRDEFAFDAETVWKRYGGEGSMEKFLEDGNVVVSGVFDWIVKDPELTDMVDAEFEMYRHHLREQNGLPNFGWCRNMWHSLVQQVMRQDPVFYALNVAARPDKNWRLVSFPYYTKYAMDGDRTGFKHIDVNVQKLLKSGRGENTVQTAISLDDEFEDGCTLVVPGFQRHIGEWWGKVECRGKVKGGLVQGVEDIYSKEDEEMYGSFVPVVCKRGDIRMTLASVIHGSTRACVRRRRVVHPWLVGVDSDHDGLDMEESGSWEEVSRANRDMLAMRIGPTGQSHRFGVGDGQFAGCVEIRGVSPIGDVLVGARGWESGPVLRERDAILGSSERKAWKVVATHRERMKRAWREGFLEMVELEKEEFGEKSYFKWVNERGYMDVLAQAASRME